MSGQRAKRCLSTRQTDTEMSFGSFIRALVLFLVPEGVTVRAVSPLTSQIN